MKKAYEAPMINEELIEVLDVIATSNGGDTVDGISINMGSLFPKGGNQ